MANDKQTMTLITIITVILMETVSDQLIIVSDFVDDHSEALNALFNKLQWHKSHCSISSVVSQLSTGKLIICQTEDFITVHGASAATVDIAVSTEQLGQS